MFAAFIILPTRFWPRNDRELPFLAIALNLLAGILEIPTFYGNIAFPLSPVLQFTAVVYQGSNTRYQVLLSSKPLEKFHPRFMTTIIRIFFVRCGTYIPVQRTSRLPRTSFFIEHDARLYILEIKGYTRYARHQLFSYCYTNGTTWRFFLHSFFRRSLPRGLFY